MERQEWTWKPDLERIPSPVMFFDKGELTRNSLTSGNHQRLTVHTYHSTQWPSGNWACLGASHRQPQRKQARLLLGWGRWKEGKLKTGKLIKVVLMEQNREKAKRAWQGKVREKSGEWDTGGNGMPHKFL